MLIVTAPLIPTRSQREQKKEKKLETLIVPVVKAHKVFRIHRLSSINYVQRIKAVNNLPLKLTLKYNCIAHQNRLKRSLLRQEKLSDGWKYLLRQPSAQSCIWCFGSKLIRPICLSNKRATNHVWVNYPFNDACVFTMFASWSRSFHTLTHSRIKMHRWCTLAGVFFILSPGIISHTDTSMHTYKQNKEYVAPEATV